PNVASVLRRHGDSQKTDGQTNAMMLVEAMERAPTVESFLRDPLGRWVVPAPTAIVFCAHAELGGSIAWGRPTREDTERLLAVYEALHHPGIAERFDVVLDGRSIEGVDP